MSETMKATEATRRTTEQAAKASQAAIDGTGTAAKESINEMSHLAQAGADRARDSVQSMTETVAETANAAATMSSKAAEQSREVMLMGVRTAAGLSSRVADINFGRSHHLFASAAHAMDIYRDTADRSADRVRALFSSYMALGRGLQHMQHAWLEMIDHSMENASHKPQDLLHCKNIVELAEVQRDLYLDAINHAFESTSRLMEIAGRTAQDAVQPLQSAAR